MASPGLEEHIQGLPQELRDIIFEFAIAIDIKQIINIDPHHKSPLGLQINRATRQKFAPRYFSSGIFCAPGPYSPGASLVRKWLSAQTQAHRDAIRTLRTRIDYEDRATKYWGQTPRKSICAFHIYIVSEPFPIGLGLTDDQRRELQVNVRFRGDDGEIEEEWANSHRLEQIFA